MARTYDIAIIGAGPAGIFAALELAEKAPQLRVVLLEKGPDIARRNCPMKAKGGQCINCHPCSILTGWGGAGAFSDGKLTLTTEFGGILDQYLGRDETDRLISYIDGIYLRFGATPQIFGADPAAAHRLQRQAAAAGLQLIPARIRHLGTEECFEILRAMREYLSDRVEIRTLSPATQIVMEDAQVRGLLTARGETILARYVVVAPGREGAEWFSQESKRLGLKLATNPVDVGVRVEVPATVLEHLTEEIYESKIIYYTKAFDDQVRTFCMNPYGEVVIENNSGLITVNGHSYLDPARRTENTNFALLVSKSFTEPFRDPITYGKNIATLANLLGGGVLVQRLGDLQAGRRSTEKRISKGMVRPTLKDATPGDLSLVLPYRHLVDILEMLQAMDRVAPGVNSPHTLLYGVEVKFYSSRLELSAGLESKISNLFAAGDGAGVTRGLAQASASGIHVAREILAREGI
ncbi:MAG: NAD(P)/FAD-dependent oxidoreductase [Firmicutes bacterium]|nr:NAD(P)/FAD-dependent oxidoreductase [Bacillota bacterium]